MGEDPALLMSPHLETLRISPIVVGTNMNAGSRESPATPDEKMAASALLSLLSSPKPVGGAEKLSWGQPSLKRSKSDSSVGKRRPKGDLQRPSKAQKTGGSASIAAGALTLSMAVDGAVDAAKQMEGDKWLHRRVELVRGKYKGRSAVVLGMTAKKYRVRVEGVEHQLEVNEPSLNQMKDLERTNDLCAEGRASCIALPLKERTSGRMFCPYTFHMTHSSSCASPF